MSLPATPPPDFDALARELGLLDATAARRLHQLRDELLRGKRCAAFIGAGVSRGSDLPNWEELTRDLADYYGVECPARPADNAYPAIIEGCMRKAPSEEAFWNLVADKICGGTPSELHSLLMKLPFEAFLTTNFDCLLDTPHGTVPDVIGPRIISCPDLHGPDIGGRRLVHLHGRCQHDDPQQRLSDDKTVLTQSGYSRAYSASNLVTIIESAIETYFLLFVGASLGDWQIRLLLSKVRELDQAAARLPNGPTAPKIRGLALVESDGQESGEAADFTWSGKVLGIEAIFYLNPDGEHLAVGNAIRWLISETTVDSSTGRYEVDS